MENKELLRTKCKNCLNLIENPDSPFEKGAFRVSSDYHGWSSLRIFHWCSSLGCIKKAKRLAKDYQKYLNETGLYSPLDKVKELEAKHQSDWDKYKE